LRDFSNFIDKLSQINVNGWSDTAVLSLFNPQTKVVVTTKGKCRIRQN